MVGAFEEDVEDVDAPGFLFFIISAIRALASAMSSAVDRFAPVAIEAFHLLVVGKNEPTPSELFRFLDISLRFESSSRGCLRLSEDGGIEA
jgi:hypothetical protein